MFLSMTGFASITENLELKRKDGTVTLAQISCEAKSINSRFFEANIKLPGNLSALEVKILTLAKKFLVRGKLYFNLNFLNSNAGLDETKFSMEAAKQYFKIINNLANELGVENNTNALDILKLPGVLNADKLEINPEFEDQVLTVVIKALEQLNSARATEGQNLKIDLNQRLENCHKIIIDIKSQNLERLEVLKHAVVKLELAAQQHPDNEMLENELQEARHLLDKTDINEEIVRFSSHLATCAEIFKSSTTEKGKQLDFLCQELVRETNTICAKSQELKMVQFGIATKVELEKIKEQIQNLV